MKKIKNIVLFLFVMVSSTGYSQCVEGNCVDGFGIFKCSCGYTYEGEFKNGEKVNGTLTKEDLVYTGEFKNDVAEGQGVIKFIDSTWYEGSFINNFPDGYGVFHFADGTTYTGEMSEGNFKGLGIMNYSIDSLNIKQFNIGKFENDKLNGMSLMVDSNKWYLGQVVGGVQQGFGVFLLDSGEVVAGKIKKGKPVKISPLSGGEDQVLFESEQLKIGEIVFKAIGNKVDREIKIWSSNNEGERRLVYVSAITKQFFTSEFGVFPVGRVINLKGEIWDAVWNQAENKVELTQKIK